jgi:hypothetical protein
MSEIINKVAQSKLVLFDLEAYYPAGKRVVLDIKEWLFEELLLKEKDFRAAAANHDWQQYEEAYVAVDCSSEAIVPAWAYMLITTYLQPFAKQVFLGGSEAMETALYQQALNLVDFSEFRDKPIIIKGCSKKPVPPAAYLMAVQKLQPVARSIFYGEACSSVPLFKRK